jgi:hypothetical protein
MQFDYGGCAGLAQSSMPIGLVSYLLKQPPERQLL